MKFTINIDCTPEEARQFFGFPNLKPMQDEVLKQMQDQMMENIQNMDPQDMVVEAAKNFTDIQKAMWENMTGHLNPEGDTK